MIRDTAAPASSVWREARQQRPHRRRRAQHPQRQRGRDPQRPLGADEHAEQIRPLVPHRQRDALAVRQHDVGREHVIDREAVLEAVRAARVLGDVAADRADLLRGRIGRVVEALRRDRARHLEIRHPRLDDDEAALDVDLEHPRHPRQRDHDPLRHRQRAAREPRPRAARDERDPVRRGTPARPRATSVRASPAAPPAPARRAGPSGRRTRRCAAARDRVISWSARSSAAPSAAASAVAWRRAV